MAQRHSYQRPQEQDRSRDYGRDFSREGRYQGSSDRDRYRAGGERRYSSEWDERDERGFEGDRSYSRGGYPEEVGYRREGDRDERDDYGAQRRGYPYQGSGPDTGAGRGRGTQSVGYNRGDFTGEQNRGFGEWANPTSREDQGSYYGTGHQGGGFGSAAGSRAISRDPYEPSGAGIDFYGRSSYPSEGNRWQSQEERGGRGGYGRDRDYGQQYGGQSAGRTGGQRFSGSGYGGESQYGYGGSQSQYGGSQGQASGWQESRGGREQSYRGRGPKGYQRTDDRLKELVCECLMEDPEIDASDVTIEVSGSVVTLSGTVEDRRAKYQIEDAVESVGGVKDINNQLRVQQAGGAQSGSQQAQGNEASAGRGSERSSSSSTSGTSGAGGSQSTGSTSKRNS